MSSKSLRRWQIVLLLVGVAISLLYVARSQVSGDQLSFLARGWLLAFGGEVVPYGLLTSSGGKNPGSLTSLLAGLPLLVWEDHRAPTLLLWLTHLVAFAVLFGVFRRVLRPTEQLLFTVLFWISPWRLYYSSFLWPPNFMILMGAFFTWSLFELRRRPRLGWSFLHVLSLGLAFQIHPSSFLLVLASALLLWRRYLRIHWVGAALAAAAVVVSLLPWLAAVVEDPSLLPTGTGMPGRGLLLLFPVFRGLMYWIRYSSPAVSSSFLCLDFLGADLIPHLLFLAAVPAIWANLRLWRHRRRAWSQRVHAGVGDREWLKGLTRWVLLATLLTAGLAPTTIMSWQLLPFFHFALLPLVFVGGALWRSRRSAVVRIALPAYATLSVVLALAIAFASPLHRCGGASCGYAHTIMPLLRTDHPIFDDLRIRQTCPVTTDDPDGWWTDVLPEGVPVEESLQR